MLLANLSSFLDLDLFDIGQSIHFILLFSYTLAVVFIILHFIYSRHKGKSEYKFTGLLIAAIVFQLCLLLSAVPLELGFAIGLFAVFGVLRYRTNPIPPRDMTYLFIAIGLSAKNALAIDELSFISILISDSLIVVTTYTAEKIFFPNRLMIKIINYDKVDLVDPEKRELLYEDLDTRMGIKNIEKIQLGKVDLVKGVARIKVYLTDTSEMNFEDN